MKKTIVTHSGNFHADDVFAVATLLLVYPEAEIVRSRDPEIISGANIVVDVGGVYDPVEYRFDHHQIGGAGKRENGIPYASFGLVWKEFGERVCGDREVMIMIDEKLASPVDALDNAVEIARPVFPGIRAYSILDYLYSFRDLSVIDEEGLYKTFMVVVNIAKDLLEREIKLNKERAEDLNKVRKIVENTPDKRIIVFGEQMMSWQKVLIPHKDVLFLVHPRKEGNWGVRAIPEVIDGFVSKKTLPQSWAGKSGQELVDASGVPEATFCHSSGFMCVAETKEGAMALARKALDA